ncbi:unnamed protein product [Polarella glacialis]|uniref:RING-type domain-containing protein n=1 Tax=Polarella glacialis TaxID=89957 RepID=A0A813IG29_POLGL|nr:unnamed protein product [Polarella glacialis]CAE8597305.1 unnamed protein product [Polarella glacialis]CAE8649948.1 unnamed protein product [Polarella glacialis]CAE8649951.1 unnamed protein product [Polarella glacialis]
MGKRGASSGGIAGSQKLARQTAIPGDAWDCPICDEALSGRIFQCQQGHHLCEECLTKIRSTTRQCPSCREVFPSSAARNLALEKLAANVDFPCRWTCGFQGRPDALQAHHSQCALRTVKCPVDNCLHQCSASDMLEHLLSEQHKDHIQAFNCWDAKRNDRLFFEEKAKYRAKLVRENDLWVLCHSLRVANGEYSGKVCHVLDPVMFSFTVGNETLGSVTIESPSLPLHNPNATEANVVVPGKIAARFIKPEDVNGGQGTQYKLSFRVTLKRCR